MAGIIDAKLHELGIDLPQPATPAAAYVPWTLSGKTLYVSGQIPVWNGEIRHIGRVGAGVGLEEAQAAARLCALNIIAHAKAACGGDLDRVVRVLKLGGFVASDPDFTDQPLVINGASELFVAVFGEAGRHARFAVGAAALPRGVAVEVEAILELA